MARPILLGLGLTMVFVLVVGRPTHVDDLWWIGAAQHLTEHGSIDAPLVSLFLHMGNPGFWYPPLHFWMLSLFFRVVGSSPVVVDAVWALWMLGLGGAVAALLRRRGAPWTLVVALVVVCLFIASGMGLRPELPVTVLFLWGLVLLPERGSFAPLRSAVTLFLLIIGPLFGPRTLALAVPGLAAWLWVSIRLNGHSLPAWRTRLLTAAGVASLCVLLFAWVLDFAVLEWWWMFRSVSAYLYDGATGGPLERTLAFWRELLRGRFLVAMPLLIAVLAIGLVGGKPVVGRLPTFVLIAAFLGFGLIGSGYGAEHLVLLLAVGLAASDLPVVRRFGWAGAVVVGAPGVLSAAPAAVAVFAAAFFPEPRHLVDRDGRVLAALFVPPGSTLLLDSSAFRRSFGDQAPPGTIAWRWSKPRDLSRTEITWRPTSWEEIKPGEVWVVSRGELVGAGLLPREPRVILGVPVKWLQRGAEDAIVHYGPPVAPSGAP